MGNHNTGAYDAIVIGAGQGGGPLAGAIAARGRHVALVEKEHVGGSCINEGCTPTKTMVASARTAYVARRASDYGVRFDGGISVEMEAVRQRKRDIVDMFRSGSQRKLEETENLDLIIGEASFADKRVVVVKRNNGADLRLEAPQIFINTGTSPRRPPIAGIEEVHYLDNRSIMELDEVPEHLLVVGGGYIGVEFGQMFRRFGSRVTILQRSPQLLPREDEDVASAVEEILREDGIEIVTDAVVDQVRNPPGGKIAVRMLLHNKIRTVEGTHLLIAAGRSPNTGGLNLPAAGIETSKRGHIQVDDRLETSAAGVYALGDVKGGPAFTHISYDDYRILKANLLDGGSRITSDRLVPYTVFIDPQLGRVGLSEREARDQGREYRVAKLPMSSVARALEVDETRGFMKALIDPATNRILGAAILGIEGGEVMSVLQVAMMGEIPYQRLRDGVFAHPTLAESLNNLFQTVD